MLIVPVVGPYLRRSSKVATTFRAWASVEMEPESFSPSQVPT